MNTLQVDQQVTTSTGYTGIVRRIYNNHCSGNTVVAVTLAGTQQYAFYFADELTAAGT